MARDNPWLARKVVGFAHQGGAAEGPPSTIEAMRRAREHGASALEFDLHLTRDKQLVLNHDKVLHTPSGPVKIQDETLERLRELKPDVAELHEVLDAFPQVPLTVEIKRLRAARRAARALADEPGDRPVIVTAFNPLTVLVARWTGRRLDLAPGLAVMAAFWLASRARVALPVSRRHVALQSPSRFDQVKGL
jgi:glycerophosphoryl diester phosphodiesterase